EVIDFTGEKNTKAVSRTMTMEGKTIFDAARNAISISGKRLYWSHMKTVIISKRIAVNGVIEVLDWFARDSETRSDVNILVSKEETAKEVLQIPGTTEIIKGLEINEALRNEKSLAKAPQTDVLEMIGELQAKGMDAVAPAIKLKKINGEVAPSLIGTAIFKADKLEGFLDDEETKDLLFIRNKVKAGILVEFEQGNEEGIPISLEVFQSKTKVEPVIKEGKIQFNVNTDTEVAIDEIGGSKDVVEEEGRKKLEQEAAENLKTRMEKLIKKMQVQDRLDIFGFGAKLREEKPKVWKSVENNWLDKFKNTRVNVSVRIHIRNSAALSKPIEAGE
ncbi:MAG: Ger(x)C family spore germination protein, partial [Bacillota bacterium]|nr:Ger(x)C family spore germination protein [Bacillota bacterium]